MDAQQIYSILKSDDFVSQQNFFGVFPSDLIPISALHYPCCLVVNTKPVSHSGEHWIVIVKSSKNTGYYFDSYGMSPANFTEAAVVLEPTINWDHNKVQLQSLLTTVCGQYCVFFLLHIARGLSPKQIVDFLNDNGDTAANDAFIFTFFKQRYDGFEDTKLIDFPFIKKQIASISTV
jgi:hypothetical protein